MKKDYFVNLMNALGYLVKETEKRVRVEEEGKLIANIDKINFGSYRIIEMERKYVRYIEEYAFTPIEERQVLYNLVFPKYFYHKERLLCSDNNYYYDIDINKDTYKNQKVTFTKDEIISIPFDISFLEIRAL